MEVKDDKAEAPSDRRLCGVRSRVAERPAAQSDTLKSSSSLAEKLVRINNSPHPSPLLVKEKGNLTQKALVIKGFFVAELTLTFGSGYALLVCKERWTDKTTVQSAVMNNKFIAVCGKIWHSEALEDCTMAVIVTVVLIALVAVLMMAAVGPPTNLHEIYM